jgi:serine protease Do
MILKMEYKKIFIFLIFSIFYLSSFGFSQKTEKSQTFNEILSFQEAFVKIAKEVEPAVVSISTTKIIKVSSPFFDIPKEFKKYFEFFDFFSPFTIPRERKETGLGSGVIINENGYILTNEHVISRADEIKVTLPDKREFKAEVVGKDIYSDIAVLKVETKEKLPTAKFGDSDKIKVGEWAIAIGNPFGFMWKDSKGKISPQPTVTVGVISALGRSISTENRYYEDLIQTDAAINPGNSGGPLLNIRGEVIGINTAILSPVNAYVGIGFAIPINKAKDIIEELIHKGKVVRGYLGVYHQELDENLAKTYGLEKPKGVLVTKVIEGTPAEKAGIKEGDIIIKIDDKEINSSQELRNTITKLEPGKKVIITILREENEKIVEKKIPVVIEKRPEEKEEDLKEKFRGILVSEIDEKIRKYYGITEKKGVIVVEVETGSPAEEAGISEGDIILKIDNKEILDLQTYKKIIRGIPPKKWIRVMVKKKSGELLFLPLGPEKK